ncbi:DUF7519 family protein [Halomicrobium salinisoli]|uniref:DUF7519 family protein n=1 Tax=Halomicrobium salinisoli TaxID=2878391 RepID=UPI001CF0AA53|nr:hypothetical protein [Halomicrobium salinisoli]
MTGRAPVFRPARRTATVAVAAALSVALAIGTAVAGPVPAVVGSLGALAVGGGVRWATGDRRRGRAAASAVTVVGSLLLVAGYALALDGPGLWLLVATTVGVAFATANAVDDGFDRDWELWRVPGRNVATVFVVALGVTFLGAFVHLSWVAVAVVGLAVTTATPLVALVAIQGQVLLVLALLSRVSPVLDDWLPATDPDERSLRDVLRDVDGADVPSGYWAVLAGQVVLALLSLRTPILGRLVPGPVGSLLTAGAIQALLWGVVALLSVVLLAEGVRILVVTFLGSDPGGWLADRAGGVLAILVAVPLGLGLTAVPHVVDGVVPSSVPTLAVAVAPLAGLTVALVAVTVLLAVASPLVAVGVDHDLLPAADAGFAVGSGLLAVSTIAAAGSVPDPVVFLGVAGALLCWDLGSHASSVGRQLGRLADTRRGEFVHLTASCLVVGGGAVAVALAHEFLVPLLAPPQTQIGLRRAVVALLATLVAVLAFVAAAALRDRSDEQGL